MTFYFNSLYYNVVVKGPFKIIGVFKGHDLIYDLAFTYHYIAVCYV